MIMNGRFETLEYVPLLFLMFLLSEVKGNIFMLFPFEMNVDIRINFGAQGFPEDCKLSHGEVVIVRKFL
jgi:hypothetical protein